MINCQCSRYHQPAVASVEVAHYLNVPYSEVTTQQKVEIQRKIIEEKKFHYEHAIKGIENYDAQKISNLEEFTRRLEKFPRFHKVVTAREKSEAMLEKMAMINTVERMYDKRYKESHMTDADHDNFEPARLCTNEYNAVTHRSYTNKNDNDSEIRKNYRDAVIDEINLMLDENPESCIIV